MSLNIEKNSFKPSFCTPIVFNAKENHPQKTYLQALGSLADQFLSLRHHQFDATQKKELPINHPILKTVLKVTLYIITALILPAIALVAKIIYRNWAITQIEQKQTPTELPVVPKNLQEATKPIVAVKLAPVQEEPGVMIDPAYEDDVLLIDPLLPKIQAQKIPQDEVTKESPAAKTEEQAPKANLTKTNSLKSLQKLADEIDLPPLAITEDMELQIAAFAEKEKQNKIVDALILDYLEKFAGGDLSDVEIFTSLLDLEGKVDKEQAFQTYSGNLAKQILSSPQKLPKRSQVELQEGQIFVKLPKRKAGIPAQFRNVHIFIEDLKEKILLRNIRNQREFIKNLNLPEEQRKVLLLKIADTQLQRHHLQKRALHVRSDSGNNLLAIAEAQVIHTCYETVKESLSGRKTKKRIALQDVAFAAATDITKPSRLEKPEEWDKIDSYNAEQEQKILGEHQDTDSADEQDYGTFVQKDLVTEDAEDAGTMVINGNQLHRDDDAEEDFGSMVIKAGDLVTPNSLANYIMS